MTRETDNQIKTISDQFNEQIISLAQKIEGEILQMVNDSALAFETLSTRKKPSQLNLLMFYDDLTIRLIHNLLVFREARKQEFLKKLSETK